MSSSNKVDGKRTESVSYRLQYAIVSEQSKATYARPCHFLIGKLRKNSRPCIPLPLTDLD